MKVYRTLLWLLSVFMWSTAFVRPASAYDSLVNAAMFTGIQADLGTAGVGIMACAAIVLGIALLIRAIAR